MVPQVLLEALLVLQVVPQVLLEALLVLGQEVLGQEVLGLVQGQELGVEEEALGQQ